MINKVDSTSFTGIYKNPHINFSRTQNEVVCNIVDKLRAPDKNDKTTEKKFAEKNSHFFIDPAKNNTVDLYVFKNAQINNQEEHITYKQKINIGNYGNGKKFNLNDIDSTLNEKKKDSIITTACLGCIGAFILMLGFCSSSGTNRSTKSIGNNIEKITIIKDSITDSINTAKTKVFNR